MSVVWADGWLQPIERAGVSVLDRGFTLGDGLFETLRVYQGMPFRLEDHLGRLEEGLARIGITLPGDPGLGRVREGVGTVLQEADFPDAALRITVSRGRGKGTGLAATGAGGGVVVSLQRYHPEPGWYREGLRAVITGGRVDERALTAGLKRIGYLESILARREAERRGADDGILLNTRGELVQGTASNVFMVVRGTLRTPGPSDGILPGITRAAVLEIAGRRGIPVWEGGLAPTMLEEADEVFLTSSLRELVPVVAVDRRPVGRGRPGPVWSALHEAYGRLVEAETGASA